MKRLEGESFKDYRIRRYKDKVIREMIAKGTRWPKKHGAPQYVTYNQTYQKIQRFIAKEASS